MLPDAKSFILQQIEDGKINVAKRYVQKNCNGKLQSSEALSVLIRLCNYVVKNASKIVLCDVYHLTKICCNNIQDDLSNLSDKYLASLYHIIRYFFGEVLATKVAAEEIEIRDYITQLTEYVLIYFKAEKSVSDINKTLPLLYHKHIVESITKRKLNDLEKIAAKSLEIFKYAIQDEHVMFFAKLNTYATTFTQSDFTHQQREGFCKEVLELLQDVVVTKDMCCSSYKVMLNLINMIGFNVYSCIPFGISVINNLVNDICQAMRNMFPESPYVNCVIIVENLFNSFLKPVELRVKRDCLLLKSCNKILENVSNKNDDYYLLMVKTCCMLQRIFKIYFTEYFTKQTHLWSTQFEPNILTPFVTLLKMMGDRVAPIEPAYALGFYLLSINLLEKYQKLSLSIPRELHNLNLQCLEKYFKLLTQREESIEHNFGSQWKYGGSLVYNFAVTLYRNLDYDLAKDYLFLFAKYIVVIDGVEHSTCFENAFAATLHLYAASLTLVSDFKRGLVFIALLMLLAPSYDEKAKQLLVSVKSQKTNEALKSITMKDLLEQEVDVIHELYPKYEYKESLVIPLLLAELEYYHRKWPSKIPMECACRQLLSSTDDPKLIAKAAYFTCRKIAILNDDLYLKKLQNAIEELEKSKTKTEVDSIICLAVLCYTFYHAKTSKLLDKIEEDMRQVATLTEPAPNQATGENESLDIVPTYQNLDIHTKIDQLNYLIKTLDLCDQLLLFNPLPLDEISNFCLSDVIRMIALEFRVQHFQFHMIRAWNLYLTYCNIFRNLQGIVESAGFILEYARGFPDARMEPIAEKTLEELGHDSDMLETRLLYYMSKCSGMLRVGQSKEACELYNEVAKMVQENGVDTPLLTARLLQLKASFLLSSCNDQLLCHKEMYLVAAHQALNTLADIYRTRPSSDPYVLSLVLESVITIGWMYKWIRFPRETRCYTEAHIRLTQRLLLPMRTAQLLSLLSYTDLLDRRFKDCEVKVDGLIWLLNRSGSLNTAPVQRNTKLKSTASIGIQPNYNNLLPIRYLDMPKTIFKNVTGSPEIQRRPFTMPKIFSHAENCACLTCTNFEYHKLLFEIVHLETLLCYYTKGDCDIVETFFNGGSSLKQKVTDMYNNFLGSCQNKLYKTIYKALNKVVHFSYCAFMLDNSYYLAHKGCYEHALQVVQQLKQDPWLKHTNIIFANEVRYQEITLRYASTHKPPALKKSPLATLNTSYESVIIKTPDNKVVSTKIKLSPTPITFEVPSTAPMKGIKLDFSDSDTEDAKLTLRPRKRSTKPKVAPTTPAFKIPEIKINKVPLQEIPPCSAFAATKAKTQAHQQQRMKTLTGKLNNDIAMKKSVTKTAKTTVSKENAVPGSSVDDIADRFEKQLTVDKPKNGKRSCTDTRRTPRTRRTANE